MSKELKAINVGLFTGKIHIPNMNPRVMGATSAGDLGIDHPDARFVASFEFPEEPSAVIQRRGWAARYGQPAVLLVVAGIVAYMTMMQQIGSGVSATNSEGDVGSAAGFNNAKISSPTKPTAAK